MAIKIDRAAYTLMAPDVTSQNIRKQVTRSAHILTRQPCHSFLVVSIRSPTLYILCLRRLRRLQLLLDIRLEILRLLDARPPVLDLSVAADKELLKVPLYALEAHEARLLVLEPLEGGVCLCAVDLDICVSIRSL